MSTHDYTIDNAGGATVRADINNMAQAIVSNNSSPTAPAPTFAHMRWRDTTANALKQRNATNTAWLTLFTFDGTGVKLRLDWDKADDLVSASTVDLAAMTGNYGVVTGTTAVTAFGTIKAGAMRWLRFAASLTLTHNAVSLVLVSGADIVTQAGDMCLVVSEGSGNWRMVYYQRATGLPLDGLRLPPRHLTGLNITPGLAPADDINIGLGECRDEANTADLAYATAIGKKVTTSWVAGGTPGVPTGGLSSSLTIANDVWYGIIAGEVAGVPEIGIDNDPTGATLGTDHGFTKQRRIGWLIRKAGVNLITRQDGDDFWLDTPVSDNSAAIGTSPTLITLTTPPHCKAHISATSLQTSNTSTQVVFTSTAQQPVAPSPTISDINSRGTGTLTLGGNIHKEILVDGNSQIRGEASSTALINSYITNFGWTDRRGRDG